jgi:hypothetical protein
LGRKAENRRSQPGCRQQDATGLARLDPRRPGSAEAVLFDALATSDHRQLVALAERLAAVPRGREELEGLVCSAVARSWDNGWQPRDLARVFARGRDAADRTWIVAAIAVESRSYLGTAVVDPGWRAQLVAVGAHDAEGPTATSIVDWSPAARVAAVIQSIARLRWLFALPVLPRIGLPPREWTVPVAEPTARPSDGIVAKVRALLAKAESTDFPAEAESLTAKAQELITRHAIDRVLLAADDDAGPTARRIPFDEPYASAKALLLGAIAHANGCRCVSSDALGFSTVFGYADDLDTVELLHTSLLVQAMRSLAAAGRDAPPGAQTRSRAYRRAFLLGFASQIGRRLREAADEVTSAEAERVGPSLLPVLASRERKVADEMVRVFPRLATGRRVTVSDGAGWVAGQAAGQMASLGLDPQVAPHLPA